MCVYVPSLTFISFIIVAAGVQLSMDKGLHEWGEATRSFVKAQQRRHAGRATFQGKIYNFLGESL